MELFAYTYVGPEEIRRAAFGQPDGFAVTSLLELQEWLRTNPEALVEGATYVVDLRARLRLAPRRSEHVACAKGEEVLAAGEIRFARVGAAVRVAGVSNQSTGYSPDVTCWSAVELALRRAGLEAPSRFTAEIVFRRCPSCGERNLVKEQWFACVFCDSDLPREWNAGQRRTFDVEG